MDQELKELLSKNLEASQESLKILKKINRDIVWRRFFGILKLTITVGLLVWGYLQLEPYFTQFSGLLQNFSKMPGGFNIEGLPPDIKKLFTPSP